MKAVMVMFDSLNRRFLPPYGGDWTHMPNFRRLAEKTVTFDTAFVGSMPCMPARRELHTGRYNFLHRSWGPLEPFDDSLPDLLQNHGVYTHLATDHYHYFEDGGATYHNRYTTWEGIRGQEGDPCFGQVADPNIPPCAYPRGGEASGGRLPFKGNMFRQDWVNRAQQTDITQQPQHLTMTAGLDFIARNREADNWFLHIETFDPHEPYFTQQKYKDLYPHTYQGKHFDWPVYRQVCETPDEIAHVRYESAALHSMCDEYLGKILDAFDRHDLWKDTLLLVNTDHGFLMSEHDLWAKCHCPFYNEVAHMPLFIWDPRLGVKNVHRRSLVQTIDLPATILEFFGAPQPADMQGTPLRGVMADDAPIRAGGLFGIHGGQVNVTDGRYVYMRGPADPSVNGPLYNYTHMPTHMRGLFHVEELRTMTAAPAFKFTKGCPVMKIDCHWGGGQGGKKGDIKLSPHLCRTELFDLHDDYAQQRPLNEPEIEARMVKLMIELMKWNDAPAEQYERLGLTL